MTALNFPDSPSNGDTYQGYTYNSTKGTWAKPLAPDPAITSDGSTPSLSTGITGAEVRTLIGAQQSGVGTTAVVANVAALPGSASTGDMAFVTGTNRLYLWNGSGWYNIALINTTPTISGANANYELAIDGTATTVTITATDPEGLPITYSLLSDTSGNTATVTQGTGANTNVFTITPSTNTAHAGTFSLTFRASDGVNIASAVSAFTLQFQVQNQRYTTALITSVGANNAVNNSFDDKSTSDLTITANGDVHQTTFSPYRHGGYSMEFDGTGDWIDTPNHADFDLDGEFTIEFWVYIPGSYARTIQRVIAPNSSGYSTAPYISIGNDTGITGGPAMAGVLCATRAVGAGNPQMHANQTGTTATGTATLIPLDTWTHCALTRDSNNVCRLFQAGTLVATNTDSNAFDFTYGNTVGARIGRSGWGAGETLGPANLKDFRIVKGTCLYTSNFTPPTETLTAVTNTKLLIFDKPYLKDGGETGHALTISGDPKIVPRGSFDARQYSAASHGGSAYFDGNGDGLTITTTDFQFSGQFTFEAWVYWDGTVPSDWPMIFDTRPANSGNANALAMNIHPTSHRLNFYIGSTNYYWGTTALPKNQWVHTAVVRDSNNDIKIYQNGVQGTGTVNSSATLSAASALRIGYNVGSIGWWPGNITQFRVSDTARYTSTFTPPTASFTSDSNTKFLMEGTDAGIIDKAQVSKQVKLVGNTKSSTDQYKFLTSSMYFDGTGDYVQLDNIQLPADFTIELWARLNVVTTSSNIPFVVLGNSSSTGNWQFDINASNNLRLQYNVTGDLSASTGLTANTWHHLAVVRSGTTVKIYKDGTEVASGTISQNFNATETVYIARNRGNSTFLNGYVSDVRITAGLARYTANFTPPTAALQG